MSDTVEDSHPGKPVGGGFAIKRFWADMIRPGSKPVETAFNVGVKYNYDTKETGDSVNVSNRRKMHINSSRS
jgi:hypothetical protein